MTVVGKIEFAPRPQSATMSWDSIARRYVEHDTTAQTTFGELGAYGKRTPTKAGCSTVAGALECDGPLRRLALNDAPGPSTYLRGPHDKEYANDNLAESLHTRLLAPIRDLPGFVYLGSPYSLYKGGHDEAARVVAIYAAALMASGLRVYSPIAHGHFVTAHGKLPLSWDFWKEQCQPMIDAASSMVVLTMDGWRESVGLTYEIEEFARCGKPVVYVAPVKGRAAA